MAANIFSLLSVIYIKTLVQGELTDTIYVVWKQVFLNVRKSFGVSSYIDGTVIVPSLTIMETNNKVLANLAYSTWKKKDIAIPLWINATLS